MRVMLVWVMLVRVMRVSYVKLCYEGYVMLDNQQILDNI